MTPSDRMEYERRGSDSFAGPEAAVDAATLPSAQELSPRPVLFDADLREGLETVLLILVLFFMSRFAVENFRIEGSSMEPNFFENQYLLVNKVAYKIGHPQRNDVIVFHFPLQESKNYIKRVIGLPGETVRIEDGLVYVNDLLVPEQYSINQAEYSWGPSIVPPGQYFVLGDNRPESSDSHSWGFVPARDIVGKAWLSYWPPNRWGFIPDYVSSAAASP